MTWFGKLDLAYKYAIVFGGLIALTLLAGACKVWYNHRRLKKFTEAENVEAGKKEDQVELAQREKDEGDLFGIRAIEAGYFGGVHQSRPTSRAGSYVGSENGRGTSTLLGGVSSALKGSQYTSMNSSVTTLAATPGDENGPRKAPPAIRLAPSEAELNGRINHNVAVNMNLNVPPSPVMARHPQSPTFGGSDTESDGGNSPSLSPRSPTFPSHYAPRAPQIPMPHGLSVQVHAPEGEPRSQAASFNDSAPSSRGPSPQIALPSLPPQALRDDPPKTAPKRPSSPPRLLPQTYQPTHMHQRDMSDASSVYDMNRASMVSNHQSSSSGDSSYNFSFPEHARRNSGSVSNAGSNAGSLASSMANKDNRQSTFLSAGPKSNDPRLSEFYDAYYRQSQLITPNANAETTKPRPGQLNLAQETIVEVESPLPSPNPAQPLIQPGAAL